MPLLSGFITVAGARCIHLPMCMMGRWEPEGIVRLLFILQRKTRPEQLRALLEVTPEANESRMRARHVSPSQSGSSPIPMLGPWRGQ